MNPAIPPAVFTATLPCDCARARRRRVGFTLVELLVVIGIIALLISILMPALARAKDHANRAKCLSNLRQIGQAFVMYMNENKGAFPYGARGNEAYMEDWISWQITAPAAGPPNRGTPRTKPGLEYSALYRYLGQPQDALFQCPSDDVNGHPSASPGGRTGSATR